MIISALHHNFPIIYNFEACRGFFITVDKEGIAKLNASDFHYEGIACLAKYRNYDRAFEVLQQIQDAAVRGDKIYVLPTE